MDSILLSEIRRVHELIRAEEKHLSVEAKKAEHMTFVEHCEMLLHLSNVARKEGLLALEQAGEKLVSCEEQDFAKEIILMIVDGCFPKMVKKVSLLKYFSTEQNAYQAIKNLMTIYALLAVQDGENPRNIVRMMKGMLPGDVHNEVEHLNDGTSFFLEEQVNQELDLEAYCNGELRIKECDLGYFETKLCEDMLLSLENRAMQRLLRDIDSYDLQRAMNVFSGKGRKHIFENLSTRKGKELAKGLQLGDLEGDLTCYIFSEWEMKRTRECVVNILSLIEKLEASGEIAFMVNSNTRFLSLFMKQIAQNEEINKAKEKECDLLLETIKNYKRFYLNS